MIFGNWTTLEPTAQATTKTRILCRCTCGVEKPVFYHNLLSGKSTSCAKCHFARVRKKMGSGTAKLTRDQVREIKALIATGEPLSVIGVHYGVAYRTIWDIKSGKSWTDVQ